MGDALPQTPAGITVSVADKVDSLVGLIGAGESPLPLLTPLASAELLMDCYRYYKDIDVICLYA